MKQIRRLIHREFYRTRLGRVQIILELLPLELIGFRYMFLRGMTIKKAFVMDAFHSIDLGLLLFGVTLNITDKRASKYDPDIFEEEYAKPSR